jgi:hypothetical protein
MSHQNTFSTKAKKKSIFFFFCMVNWILCNCVYDGSMLIIFDHFKKKKKKEVKLL